MEKIITMFREEEEEEETGRKGSINSDDFSKSEKLCERVGMLANVERSSDG